LTQFNKDQLNQLLLHWRIPAVVVTEQWYCFSREELLIVCIAMLATGDPLMHLIPGFLLLVCSAGVKPLDGLLTNHLFNSTTKFLESLFKFCWVIWNISSRQYWIIWLNQCIQLKESYLIIWVTQKGCNM
jgi:hypothetical protein